MQIKPEFVFARVIVRRFQKLFLCFYSMKGFSLFMIIDTTLRQCHCLPICFLTSDLTIRNKNQRTLIVRRAGLSNTTQQLIKQNQPKMCRLKEEGARKMESGIDFA